MRILLLFFLLLTFQSFGIDKKMNNKKYNLLSRSEKRIILQKGTEAPFSGKYNDFFKTGTYLCKQCDAPLYQSTDKFKSSCGWPSFDDEIVGAVEKIEDADGVRIEILCAKCGGHLGHVFKGEKLTKKDTRHCVNSISLKFKSLKKAYFAGGCFWGVEYYFDSKDGVVSAISGYMGGKQKNPTYNDVCTKNDGHIEVVEVTYDPDKVSYKDLAKLFFEIHNPTQIGGQGPDIGHQYISAIFYNDEDERKIAQNLIDILKAKGFKIVTKLIPVAEFWKAEVYHQNYYKKTKKKPYCHTYHKRF